MHKACVLSCVVRVSGCTQHLNLNDRYPNTLPLSHVAFFWLMGYASGYNPQSKSKYIKKNQTRGRLHYQMIQYITYYAYDIFVKDEI